MPVENKKNEIEALFFDLDGTVYNTFEAIGCISDVANLYAKSYNMDAGVVFGLMRDNVDSSNFFNTDISHMCYALGPAVAKHAILKVTNPEKATEIENKYLADNSKRIENNYSQKSEENPASSGMVELSPYHNKANAEYSYMQKLFAKGYNSASTDAEKAKLEQEFSTKTADVNDKIQQYIIKEADMKARDTFTMFDNVVEIIKKAKESGAKVIAMTDSTPMEVITNAVRSGLPLDAFDELYMRGNSMNGSSVTLDDVASKSPSNSKAAKIIASINDKTFYTNGWKPHGQKVLDICDKNGINKKKVAFYGDSVKSDGGTAIQANEVSNGEADIVFGYARYGAEVSAKAEYTYWHITDKEGYKLGVKTHDEMLAAKNPESVSDNTKIVTSENGAKSKVVTLHSFADIDKNFKFVAPSNDNNAINKIAKQAKLVGR